MLRETRDIDSWSGEYVVIDKNDVVVAGQGLKYPRGPLQLTADTYKVIITSSSYWLRNARGAITLTSRRV
jgi:hypothetical protein